MPAFLARVFAGAALALLGGLAAAADLGLMPVALHLDRAQDRTTVHVTNNGVAPVVLQADAIEWRRENGVDHDISSDDLIVNPAVFTIAPGRTQLIRVGLRRSAAAEREMTYRLVLREVPTPQADAAAPVQGNVRVLVTLRLPVYVAPAAVRREQRWQARYDDTGRLVAQVTNHGNVHYLVGAVRVQGTPIEQEARPTGAESVLFPGEQRSYRLPLTEVAFAKAPVTLEVTTDRGVQHVALDPPPR